MKLLFLLVMAIQILMLSHESLGATCKYLSGDIAVVGKGKDKITAHSQAVERCFDTRVALYEKKRGALSEGRGLDFIDSCVNLKCK